MTKDVLTILVSDVDVERLFSMTRDVVIFRRNRFHDATIENIMILKKNCYAADFVETKRVENDTCIFDQAVDDELLEEMIVSDIE
jgi:hypothetical protein